MQVMQTRSQLSSLRSAATSVSRPAPLVLRPCRSVAVKAQQQQPMMEKAALALTPLSIAVAEMLTHPALALAEEEASAPGRLFDCE